MMRARDGARHRGRAPGLGARDEMSGSTITLTSLGALGGIVSTPVINRPEVAIVGVNKIVVRPVWRDGGFVPRKTMNLSSSFDHRVVDGFDAASFIQRLRALLEAPALLFVEGDMNELPCKVLIIGGGPGGYVAAIRAGQLGLDTILVEEGRLGGTCLNVGCIPSKALIHAAEAFHALRERRRYAMGLSVGRAELDYAKTIAWKDGIVPRLTTGVGALLKKAGVRSLRGRRRSSTARP